jgi:hypothetical protein
MLSQSSTLKKESAHSTETVINYYETRPRHIQKAVFFKVAPLEIQTAHAQYGVFNFKY